VLVFFAILFSYIGPAMNFFDAWQGSHTTDTQLQGLQQEHKRLTAQAASLKDPNAEIEEARRMGMVLDSERSFVVKNLPRSPHSN
jgi:hypothetical protein